jgi:hypothetical protein
MACSVAVMRSVPAGISLSSATCRSSDSMSLSRGATTRNSRSPASVTDTLRVVRVNSRTPSRASSPRIVWLSIDWEMPNRAAARVKLRSSATAINASRSL